MKIHKRHILTICLVFLLIIALFFNNKDEAEDFKERAKISLREVGHHLLLVNKDSTSLVLPVIEKNSLKYRLSFQNHLIIDPDTLVTLVEKSLQKRKLSKHYRVEVYNCEKEQVVYSYEITNTIEKDSIACSGRILPNTCYFIEVKFIGKRRSSTMNYVLIVLISLLIIAIVYELYQKFQQKESIVSTSKKDYIVIGIFTFYPNENKLILKAEETQLSKKETQLLEILMETPNVVVKREELSKRIWEDNGVFVGRSLDTYISKLRKKLHKDPSIKITNIHGVGYKIEVENKR